MKTSRENNAMEHHLRSRTTTTWNAAPSYMWLQALINLHPRLCSAISRYTLLRWSIGGESDCAFWNRFHNSGTVSVAAKGWLTPIPKISPRHCWRNTIPAAHLHPDYRTGGLHPGKALRSKRSSQSIPACLLPSCNNWLALSQQHSLRPMRQRRQLC